MTNKHEQGFTDNPSFIHILRADGMLESRPDSGSATNHRAAGRCQYRLAAHCGGTGAPIAAQLDNIRALALTPPYQPDTIKARLDELAEKRVEIGKLKNELTEIAKKTKNGKAVIAPPASATTEGAKTSKGK